jgi:hypothetical protein
MNFQVTRMALAFLSGSQPTSEVPTAEPARAAWAEAGEMATAVRASIAVSNRAGTMSRKEVRDYGEDGINLVAQYATPDNQIYGTIFIYRPSLADSGLTFLATDEAIRRRMGASAKTLSDQSVTAGGIKNSGRRVIYADSQTGLRSALMIVQAGGWLLKYRVSGPSSRANEISGNLDALVDGTKFGKGSEPLPTHVIESEPCSGNSAAIEPTLIKPQGSAAVALALLSVPRFVDEKGNAADDPTGRVPDRLCLAESSEDEKIPLLTYRTLESSSGLFAPKIFQLYGDAGIIVEVTRPSKASAELFAIRHSLGPLLMYGGFSSEPNAKQLALIRKRATELPIVAVVTEKPAGKGSDITLYCNNLAEGCSEKK